MLTFQTSSLLCCLLLLLLVYYIYQRMKTRYNFWTNLRIPYEPPTFLFGNIKDMILGKAHIVVDFDRIYKSFPEQRYVGFFEFFRPHLMIRDPQLIDHVLAKDFHVFHSRGIIIDEQLDPLEGHILNLDGDRWKMVRSKLSPTFSSSKLKLMNGIIDECVKDLDDHLNTYAENEQPINIRETMARFTTDVIGRCAFGLDFNSLKDPNSEYRKIGKKIMTPTKLGIAKNFARMLKPDILVRFRIKVNSKPVEEFFTNLFRSTMTYRKEQNVQRNDFMQLMINLYDREISKPQNKMDGKAIANDKELEFTDNLPAANIFIFYLAGFETTASTLGYLFYELALNPDIQNKLRDEIKQVIDEHNGLLNYDVLHDMKYMDMAISETLRKYNPAVIIGRESSKDYQIPGTSIILPAKTRITIPIHSIHHDPKYYPEPDKFLPERFSEENLAQRPSHTFLPFGDGPRICIGLRFAKLEMKSCLAHIIPKYQLNVCKETIVPVRLKPRSILYTPSHDITISISKL